VAGVIEAALGDLKTSKKVLIIDQLDLLLAATGDDVTSVGLQNMLLSLRGVSFFPSYSSASSYLMLTRISTACSLYAAHPCGRLALGARADDDAGARARGPGALAGARG
jgi:hypothetical protein